MAGLFAMGCLVAVRDTSAQNFSENFNNVNNLGAAGWFTFNLSNSPGTINYFQGNTSFFNAQAGPNNSYIAADYQGTTGTTGNETQSQWLLTPQLNLHNGDTFSFWTRTDSPVNFPDRLEVRLSTSGASTNVGNGPTTVGAFGTLLLSINPTLTTTGYPTSWTQFTVTVSGLAGNTTGRFAFRYFVTNGGPNGRNAFYIGIDTVNYSDTVVPEPATWFMAAGALGALGFFGWRRAQSPALALVRVPLRRVS